MEEVVKIDVKGLFARIFGLKSPNDNQAKIDEEVAKINKISSGVSWEDWEGQFKNIDKGENSKRRRRLPKQLESETNHKVQAKNLKQKRGIELEK